MTFESVNFYKHLQVLVVIVCFMVVDLALNFIRSTRNRTMTVKKVAKQYLRFFFWVDLLNVFNLDQYTIKALAIIKITNVRKVFRGSHTIKRIVTQVKITQKKFF